jgi:Protein of unknown function (DUF2934)
MAVKNTLRSTAKQTSTDIAEKSVKVAAYFIWEKEGRPNGEDLRHWYLAIAELSSNGTSPQTIRAARKTKVTTVRRSLPAGQKANRRLPPK